MNAIGVEHDLRVMWARWLLIIFGQLSVAADDTEGITRLSGRYCE